MEAHQPHLCLDSAYFISLGGGCGIKAAMQGPGLFTVMATLLLIIAVQVSSPLTRVLVVFFFFFSAADFLGMTTKLGPYCSHYSPAYEDTEQVEERLPWKLPTLLPLQ